jgi:hypothetical protein
MLHLTKTAHFAARILWNKLQAAIKMLLNIAHQIENFHANKQISNFTFLWNHSQSTIQNLQTVIQNESKTGRQVLQSFCHSTAQPHLRKQNISLKKPSKCGPLGWIIVSCSTTKIVYNKLKFQCGAPKAYYSLYFNPPRGSTLILIDCAGKLEH